MKKSKPASKSPPREKGVSLAPLDFDSAVERLLGATPPKKPTTAKKGGGKKK
jgi:hypothetical protein